MCGKSDEAFDVMAAKNTPAKETFEWLLLHDTIKR
jgi:hypothetical protein